MSLVGMSEAARRMGIKTSNGARMALQKAGVPLVAINPRAFGVEESHLAAFIPVKPGRGRPKKKK